MVQQKDIHAWNHKWPQMKSNQNPHKFLLENCWKTCHNKCSLQNYIRVNSKPQNTWSTDIFFKCLLWQWIKDNSPPPPPSPKMVPQTLPYSLFIKQSITHSLFSPPFQAGHHQEAEGSQRQQQEPSLDTAACILEGRTAANLQFQNQPQSSHPGPWRNYLLPEWCWTGSHWISPGVYGDGAWSGISNAAHQAMSIKIMSLNREVTY